ncbi:MAG: polysaccharide biosynthesis protein [Phycisphaerales bacterium]|nr:polysaccharide biosynthesis protein [Phycisphaerales bacterium]
MIPGLVRLPRRTKQVLLALSDAMVAVVALWAAYAFRLGEFAPIEMQKQSLLFLIAPLLTVPCFWFFGLYLELTRYLGSSFAIRLGKAVLVVTLALGGAAFMLARAEGLPRSALPAFGVLLLLGAGSTRILTREAFHIRSRRDARRVLIFGAGPVGAGIANMLSEDRSLCVVGFIDDNPELVGRHISGRRVYSSADLAAVVRATDADRVLLALPAASRGRRRELFEKLHALGVHVLTIPTLKEFDEGLARIDSIREVAIEDLLGRTPVAPVSELLHRCIADRAVLVTGAGGSIGAELCRQVLGLRPRRLVLLEQSEFNLYEIEAQLRTAAAQMPNPPEIVACLGSVTDALLVERTLTENRVHTIYHAAAYKHVPIVEENEVAGAATNVIGTRVVAEAAVRTGAETFVLISTDKAVRPTSVMGATKRLAEITCQALHAAQGAPVRTRLVMVRFGNVLGSSGSVVPRFAQQIRDGGPVTVTHPDMTRYFMTIPEAVELVLQAAAMGEGGDVFVLDMGEPVRIVDLARNMIRLAGHEVRDAENPDGDIELAFTGMRPGEKLFEELILGHDIVPTEHPAIMRAREGFLGIDRLEPHLQRLQAAIDQHDQRLVRAILKSTVTEYVGGAAKA